MLASQTFTCLMPLACTLEDAVRVAKLSAPEELEPQVARGGANAAHVASGDPRREAPLDGLLRPGRGVANEVSQGDADGLKARVEPLEKVFEFGRLASCRRHT